MGKREENKRIKREALQRAALDALLQHGYEAASIEQIAAAAGVARGTFYLYFEDKLALFDALMDLWYLPVREVLDHAALEISQAKGPEQLTAVYRDLSVALAAVALSQRDAALVAFRESRSPGEAGERVRQRERQILDRVTAYTATAVERRLLSVRDPRLLSIIVYGAVERLVYEHMQGTDLGDPSLVAEEVLQLFVAALLP